MSDQVDFFVPGSDARALIFEKFNSGVSSEKLGTVNGPEEGEKREPAAEAIPRKASAGHLERGQNNDSKN